MKFLIKSTYNSAIFHAIFWVAYISYEVLFMIFVYGVNIAVVNYVFFYACNIGLFYFHFYVLDQYLTSPKSRYLLISVMIMTGFIIVMGIKASWDYSSAINSLPPREFWEKFKMNLALDFARTIQFMFLSTVIWASINFGRFRRKTEEALLKSALADKANSELKYQFAQAQNAFLKAQINPHLLFNTLNAIYSTVYINSPKDSEAVLLLSEIMRYSYEEPDSRGLVPLESEITQLKNLIKLNSYRFRDTIQLDFKIVGEPQNHQIIPLVLLTLTENMFKHGDLQQTPRSLDIAIDNSGRLQYLSKNTPKPHEQLEAGSHVGLSNTRLRLDYAYPDNYELEVTQTDELFILALNINLAYERNNY